MKELENIKRINPPSDLFEKIETKIALQSEKMNPTWGIAASILLGLIISANAMVWTTTDESSAANASSEITDSWDLNNSNQLYHD